MKALTTLLVVGMFLTTVAMADLEKDLRKAAEKGDTARIQKLLSAGVNVNAADGGGRTALFKAAEKGRIEAVRLLLDAGANKIERSPDLEEDLRKAAEKGELEKLQGLLEVGVNPNSTDKKGRTALMFASEKGHLKLVEPLIRHGADISSQLLRAWVQANDQARLDSAFQQRPDQAARAALADSVLRIAVSGPNMEAVRLAFSYGASFSESSAGRLLERAAVTGEEDAALFALENGADVARVIARVSGGYSPGSTYTPKQGWTALHVACMEGHVGVVEILLKAGADPEARTGAIPQVRETQTPGGGQIVTIGGSGHKSSRTALHVAINDARADDRQVQIVELLVEHGADVNALDNGSFTPLWLADSRRLLSISTFLKDHGATRGPRG